MMPALRFAEDVRQAREAALVELMVTQPGLMRHVRHVTTFRSCRYVDLGVHSGENR